VHGKNAASPENFQASWYFPNGKSMDGHHWQGDEKNSITWCLDKINKSASHTVSSQRILMMFNASDEAVDFNCPDFNELSMTGGASWYVLLNTYEPDVLKPCLFDFTNKEIHLQARSIIILECVNSI